jgi:hypothetical protein
LGERRARGDADLQLQNLVRRTEVAKRVLQMGQACDDFYDFH